MEKDARAPSFKQLRAPQLYVALGHEARARRPGAVSRVKTGSIAARDWVA